MTVSVSNGEYVPVPASPLATIILTTMAEAIVASAAMMVVTWITVRRKRAGLFVTVWSKGIAE